MATAKPTPFRTLSEREAAGTEALFPGVPPHLRESVASFVRGRANGRNSRSFSRNMVLSFEQASRVSHLLAGNIGEEYNFVHRLRTMPEDDLLRVADASIRDAYDWEVEPLATILSRGGSMFTIRMVVGAQGLEGRKVWALERRVSAELETLGASIRMPRVAQELAAARVDIFGMNPNPAEGLHHCVKAVEIAGLPVIEPNNPRGTLGTLAGHLKTNAARFSTAVGGAAGVVELERMCSLLWNAERPHRHGAAEQHAVAPPTQDEGEGAYGLAVLLCEWFEKGRVTSVSQAPNP